METKHMTVNVDRGIGWDSAVKQLQDNGKNKFDGFYCSKREQKGRRLYLLAIQKESSTHLFNITRPNTGRSPFEEKKPIFCTSTIGFHWKMQKLDGKHSTKEPEITVFTD